LSAYQWRVIEPFLTERIPEETYDTPKVEGRERIPPNSASVCNVEGSVSRLG
jgi:hypothetical protein